MNRKNIEIKSIGIYHPKTTVNNEFYFEHFAKQGKDVKNLIGEVYGRNIRYEIDKDNTEDNSLTMAIKASKIALENVGLTGKDIDMICLTSMVPEYSMPPSSMILHRAIDGKEKAFCYDLNANCLGMLIGMEQVYRYMESNPDVNTVLVASGDYATIISDPNNELSHGCWGDAGGAIILTRTDRDSRLLGTKFFVNNNFIENGPRFPGKGMSYILKSKSVKQEDVLLRSAPADSDIPKVIDNIKELLIENGLTVDDVAMFCFSQYARINTYLLREGLNVPEERSIYIGGEYGYTGPTSPFFVLNRALEENKVKRGDYVVFWTIGLSMQHMITLIKY